MASASDVAPTYIYVALKSITHKITVHTLYELDLKNLSKLCLIYTKHTACIVTIWALLRNDS